MRPLLTVAFPDIPADAAGVLQAFRQAHDRDFCHVVGLHFTLVFRCTALPEDRYTSHVAAVAAAASSIRFTCRYAALGADDVDDTAYVFLVPDEGNASISLLHDRLYSGPLEPHLRLDLPYIPHITIGRTKDRRRAKALCDELNRNGVHVEGRLHELAVGTHHESRFQCLSVHRLGA